MSSYRKDFDVAKYMSFLIKDDELLEKYKKIGRRLKIVSRKNLMENDKNI